MRNLKKLLAVIVSICVLATFAVPAFAETKTDAQIVTDLGMVQGTTGGVTAEYLATTPTRYQAAILFLRLKGLEDEATAFIPTDNFTDLQGLNETNKAILGYLKANPALGFEGIGNNKFDPLKPITAKEYYKVMLTALGYKENTDFTWANVLPFAASKGLYALIENTKFTVNDLATATVEALKATVKGGTMTLLAALVESGAITADKAAATGFFTATPKAFEVVTATADNLKVAKLVFSKDVNGDTVKEDNFTVDGTKVEAAKLLDDKKTVLVVMNDGVVTEQNKNIDIKVKNVKDTTGATIAEVTKTVTFIDTVIPAISGAVAKNAKTIVISASEPLNVETDMVSVYDDIKVDDSAVIADTSFDYAKNTMTLHLTSAMAKGSHKITIAKLKDFAGYVALDQSYNFDIPDDTTAPAIASAVVKSNTSIQVTFNEDVDYLTLGKFKVNNSSELTTVSQDANDWSKLTITGVPALGIGATVEIKVEYKGQKDVMGNEVKDWTNYTFKVADDTALPTVTASVESDNDIVLAFSKAMTNDAGKVTVSEADDNDQLAVLNIASYTASQAEWNSDNNQLTIKAGFTGLDNDGAKDLKINIKDMKDGSIRTNAMPETNLTVKCNDKEAPTVADNYTTDDKNASDTKDDILTFYFSEAVSKDTASNLSNYVIATVGSDIYTTVGRSLASYSDVSFSSLSSDNKQVNLKVNNIDAITGLSFKVYAIKDVAGNLMDENTVSKSASTGPDLAVGNVTSVKATAKDTIELVLGTGEDLGVVAPGAFIVTDAAGTKKFNVVKAAIDSDNKLKVKFTVGGDLGTTASEYRLALQDSSLVKDVYGVKSTTADYRQAIADGIKPTISTDVVNNRMVIKFSENVVTTAAYLESELVITKDGAKVALTNDMFTFYDEDGNVIAPSAGTVTCKKVEITLTANKTYKMQYYGNDAGSHDAGLNKVDNVADAVSLTMGI